MTHEQKGTKNSNIKRLTSRGALFKSFVYFILLLQLEQLKTGYWKWCVHSIWIHIGIYSKCGWIEMLRWRISFAYSCPLQWNAISFIIWKILYLHASDIEIFSISSMKKIYGKWFFSFSGEWSEQDENNKFAIKRKWFFGPFEMGTLPPAVGAPIVMDRPEDDEWRKITFRKRSSSHEAPRRM